MIIVKSSLTFDFSAVPQAADFLDTQPLSKGKTEKAKKKKESKNQQNSDTGFMIVPAPQLHLTSNGTSPSASASPAPKAGFSRISQAAEPAAPSPLSGTPVPTDRVRVAFGLGMKRKATEEVQGSPPNKRR